MKKSVSKRNVDLSLFSNYEAPGVFARISPSIEIRIHNFPEMLERLEGCLAFCWHCSAQLPKASENEETNTKIRQKYLRAELSEYASLEDAAKYDFEAIGLQRPPKMYELNDPRLHVVRLLRHANIHMEASGIQKTTRPATWKSPNGPVKFDHINYVVKDLKKSILNTWEAKNYSPDDILRMVGWLESEQNEWGMPHLVFRTAELYVQEIFKTADGMSKFICSL